MTHEPNTVHVFALAAIIHEVNGGQCLGAAALAEAILVHPDSQWRSALPVPTDAELGADFVAWYQDTYGEPPLGIPPSSDVIKLARHLLQRWSPQPAAPWPKPPREVPPEVLARAMSICKAKAVKAVWYAACDQLQNLKPSPQSTEDQDRFPWPELPPRPPASVWHDLNLAEHSGEWIEGVSDGWHAARAELQRGREQAGVMPAAPTFPRISDSLMRSLIGDVLDESETATEAACMDRPYNPVPRIRARLTEILRLAAQDEAKRPAS